MNDWERGRCVRFFPLEPDLALEWRLNFWDAATKKVLTLVGRHSISEFLECLSLHDHYLHIGALAWAAAAKAPDLTPELIIDWAARGNRFHADEVENAGLQIMNFRDMKGRWLHALSEARQLIGILPPEEMGCFYLNQHGQPLAPNPDAPEFKKLTRHFGSVKGAWPRIASG
jgi:hypothetical protein